MKKKSILIVIVVIALILLFPIPMKLNDGGTTEYRALLYKVTDYHKLAPIGLGTDYIEGIGIEILGKEIFNNTKQYKETETVEKERIKLKDLKFVNSNETNTSELVKFNGFLYGRSNALIDYAGDLNKSIGKIDFLIDKQYLPELNGETNCEELLYSTVLESNEKDMVLNVNNVAVLFNAIDKKNIKKSNGKNSYETEDTEYNSFIGTVLESTATYMIVEPNEDEEIRKSADKISIGLGKNNDMLYLVGTNVKITYTGEVMESYPAQVNATNIEIKATDKFELKVYEGLIDVTENKPYKILSKDETNKCDYDVYCYNVSAEIMIDGKQTRLRDALLENKITMDEIIARANKDISEKKITGDMYNDGGSMIYKYDNYTILKCHTEDGNRDVYIGTPEMNLRDVL